MRNMRLYGTTLFLMAGVIGLATCQKAPDIPSIPADYRSWRQTTNIPLNYPIPGHESHFRRIFINATGEQVQRSEKNGRAFYEFPEGTMIVKEIYDGLDTPQPNALPVLLDMMFKQPQHPQARGGWVWAVKNVQTGETRIFGQELCVDCHANANERHPYGDRNPNEEFRDYTYFLPGQEAASGNQPYPYPESY